MVKNTIKVYARIKKEAKSKKIKLENYIISRSGQEYDDLIFHQTSSDVRFSYYQFRYHKVFDQLSSQEEIFEIVAKPVVNSVIHGFNGTIFAYGQTGSGKTYSLTGCPKVYENRGIIPRCIEHIFEYLTENPESFTIHLSYLEIYNEIGYDLLNPKHIASKLEEFPRVILLEDGKGKAHLRNLSVHAVSTEKEAMRLLFLGDTNRTIAETPMNDYSSRSHCIFTIYLTSQMKRNNKTLKSKLHIVDLAGSERISKSGITGNTLNEAKNINLSLHYLEQVILALSTSKKHIPFRNSMLTYLLKDSLSGNSLTTMLATLAATKKNIEETISTCRFSKRVSMIATQPKINEEDVVDSQREINILQSEICELKTKLLKYEGDHKSSGFHHCLLGEDELDVQQKRENFGNIVEQFLNYKVEVVDLTLSEMKHCMEIMREMLQGKKLRGDVGDLKAKLTEREERKIGLGVAQGIGYEKPGEKTIFSNCNNIDAIDKNVSSEQGRFCRDKYNEEIEDYRLKLKYTYEEAKSKTYVIEQCRQNIIILRTKMDQHRNSKIKDRLVDELHRQQEVYRKTILELRNLEKKTNHLKCGLLQSEMKLRRRGSPSNCTLENDFSIRAYEDDGAPKINLDTSFNSLSAGSVLSRNRRYCYEDYNRPEKENEVSEIAHSAHHQKDLSSNGCAKSGTSHSFLQQLVDGGIPLAKDQLGLFPKSEASIGADWSSDYIRNHPVCPLTSKRNNTRNIDRQLGNILKENNESYEVARSFGTEGNDLPGNHAEEKYSRNDKLSLGKNSEWDSIKCGNHQLCNIPVVLRDSATSTIPSYEDELAKNTEQAGSLYRGSDSAQFKEFMKSVPLTGDKEVDEEILNFYRSKFKT
ncbi:kinesin-like protein KIF6 [Coccinella septempunctata]|uniref:kinesin-like protein KIF6 n=1 Tax=Coccinella septempunctata TaxID=41139 RepID=UPI001D0919C6|nr:kinesin-like protein KIF6 [Coccinella septempunctata]